MLLRPIDGAAGARIGFGCASLGELLEFKAKCRVIEAAYEAGFRYFDVAPMYAHGEGEAALATVLAGVRHEVTIVTKAGIAHPKAVGAVKGLRRLASPVKAMIPAALWKRLRRQASSIHSQEGRFAPAQLDASIAESLRRLNADSVDALLLHEVTLADLAPETLATLDGYVARGVIRALGTGTTPAETARIADAHGPHFRVHQTDHYWGAWMPALTQHGAQLVSHRSIRNGLVLLRDPLLQQRIAAHPEARALQAACADTRQAVPLLLRAAIDAGLPGLTLVGTSKPERTRQFVEMTRRDELKPLAAALNDCLGRIAHQVEVADS